MDFLELATRWLHILSAVILVGGTIFIRLSVIPALNKTESANEIFESIRTVWSKMVMASVLFLLLSGIVNIYLKAVTYQLEVVYLTLLAIKFVLALIVFFLVSLLSGRSERAVKFRSGTGWYDVTCLAMVALICLAGFMKVSSQKAPRKEKVEAEQVAMLNTNTYANFETGISKRETRFLDDNASKLRKHRS